MEPDIEMVCHLQSEQDRDFAAVEESIKSAESEIEKLDRKLSIEDYTKARGEIVDAMLNKSKDQRAAMKDRAERAAKLSLDFEEESYRRRALTRDAGKLAAFAAILPSLPTRDLIKYLDDAIESGDVGRAELIRTVFQSRQDHGEHLMEFSRRFAKLSLEDVSECRERLDRIASSNAMATTRVLETMRGIRDPSARISAARKRAA